ncbi:MAG: chromate efflux transporter [Pseudomonadota bacterium]
MTPSMAELARVFCRIGALSFGGPAAQIALMHRELVETRTWLSEDQFLRALSLCMLLPGPEAMQLATYAGWRLRGTIGGLIAGVLFVLPGALVIFALAFGYVYIVDVPLVQAAFSGIKAAVLVIVLQALVNLSRKALHGRPAWTLAGLAFVAVFAAGLPFPAVIAAAALYGAWAIVDTEIETVHHIQVNLRGTLRTTTVWAALWFAPILLLWFAGASFLVDVALFFSKLAVVTFGGAYALLAYMTQTVVGDYGWITTVQMIDALGLAETTPGPLILVTQFVAVLAGVSESDLGLGLAAGLVTLWVTFVPCFLWIFLAGPYLEAITARPRINAALKAITAAVVGVILNLAIWFGVHVLFGEVTSADWHAAPVPLLVSLDLRALLLFALAGVLILALHRSMLQTLMIMAVAGAVAGSL